MLRGSMLLRVDSLASSWSQLRGSVLRGCVLRGSMLRGSMLRVDSVGVAWLTGDLKSKSWRSLDGTPVGVKGVLADGASTLLSRSKPHVHLLDAALLDTLARAAVPHYVAHGSIGLFGGQLYLPQALGEVLELALPPFNDNVQVVGRYHVGRSGIFHTWIVLPEYHLFLFGLPFGL